MTQKQVVEVAEAAVVEFRSFSVRKHLSVLPYLLLLSLVGCESGVQGGRYIVDQTLVEKANQGEIQFRILLGHETELGHENEINLLTIVTFLPTPPDAIQSDISHGQFVSILNETFSPEMGLEFGYGVAWNRESDRLVVDDVEFVRSDGNIILVYLKEGQKKIFQVEGYEKGPAIKMLLGRISKSECDDSVKAILGETLDK